MLPARAVCTWSDSSRTASFNRVTSISCTVISLHLCPENNGYVVQEGQWACAQPGGVQKMTATYIHSNAGCMINDRKVPVRCATT